MSDGALVTANGRPWPGREAIFAARPWLSSALRRVGQHRAREVELALEEPVLDQVGVLRTMSPGFIISVWLFGVTVDRLESCGLGGPAGTPFRWMKAKFTGSMQLLFICRALSASSESMLSAAHQWVLSQLTESANGAKPGG